MSAAAVTFAASPRKDRAGSLTRAPTALVIARATPPTSNRSFRSKRSASGVRFRTPAPRTTFARSLIEAQRWGGVAGGSIFSLVVQQLPEIAAIAFLGRIGITEVASVSLASVYAYGVARTVWIGLSLAQGALISQAAGSRVYSAVFGWSCLRLIVDLATTLVITIPMFLTTHLLLEKLGFESVDLNLVQSYLLWSLPVPLMVSFIETFSVHLSAIQRVWQTVTCELAYAVIDIVFSYFLILGNEKLGIPQMGPKGAAIANIVSCSCCLILYSLFFFMGHSMPPEHLAEDGGEPEQHSGHDHYSFLPGGGGGAASASASAPGDLRAVSEEGLNAEDEDGGDDGEGSTFTGREDESDDDDGEEIDETIKAAASFRLHGKAGQASRNVKPISLAAEVSIATLPASESWMMVGGVSGAVAASSTSKPNLITSLGSSADLGDDVTPVEDENENDHHHHLLLHHDSNNGEVPVILATGPHEITHEAAVKRVSVRSVLRFVKRIKNIKTFAIQAGSATLSMAFEIGQEIMVSSFAASLGTVQVAVHNSLSELYGLLSMVLFGAGQATSIRIGHFLGSAKLQAAKRVVWVAGALVALWTVIASAVLGGIRDDLGKLFSSDPDFVNTADSVAPWLVGTYITLSWYNHASSVLDGQGRARLYPILSFVGCILITALLAGLSLRYTSWGLPGLWAAELLGNAVSGVLATFFVAKSNWKELSIEAIERSGAESPMKKAKSALGGGFVAGGAGAGGASGAAAASINQGLTAGNPLALLPAP